MKDNNSSPNPSNDKLSSEIIQTFCDWREDVENLKKRNGKLPSDAGVLRIISLIEQYSNQARINSLLDLERWIKLHDLDQAMILDGIEHMVKSNMQVPDQPRLDHTERIQELKKLLPVSDSSKEQL